MSEENLQATETESVAQENATQPAQEDKSYSPDEVANLMKALRSNVKHVRLTSDKLKEKNQLQRFADVNPDEYQKLQAEASRAAEIESRYGESIKAIEEKYGRVAAEAEQKAKLAETRIGELNKRYALEKVFNAVGGRTDAADGVSFFDMFAEQMSGKFRQEADGSLTVIDSQGDPLLDSETGKRLTPEDYVTSFKIHPVYGTFFKGVKGSGAGLNYAGTDTNGIPVEDLSGLSRDELFQRAFG